MKNVTDALFYYFDNSQTDTEDTKESPEPPKPKYDHLSDDQLMQLGKQQSQAALHHVNDANEVANATLEELNNQGEMIEHMHEGVEEIEWRLNHTSRILRGLQTLWGAVANLIIPKSAYVEDALSKREAQREPKDKQHLQEEAQNKVNDIWDNRRQANGPDAQSEDTPKNAQEEQPALTFSNPQYQQWWQDQDDDLEEMLKGVEALREKNSVIGQELDKQIEQIEDLTEGMDHANRRIQKQTRKVNILMT